MTEEYLLLLLSDSNLPSGGFIASSGLESHFQHGLLLTPAATPDDKAASILSFIGSSLHTYAALNLPFLSAVHELVSSLRANPPPTTSVNETLSNLETLDKLYESMVLNHVARRASTAQGIALLTLYERAFALETDEACRSLVEAFKANIRAGNASGHLVTGFAVLTGALDLSLRASQHLFLFLHARSLLSSAIRMNIIGPYLSHRLLLHDVRPLVDKTLAASAGIPAVKMTADEHIDEDGPATTWPLGEILGARHDQLHSKIFNS